MTNKITIVTRFGTVPVCPPSNLPAPANNGVGKLCRSVPSFTLAAACGKGSQSDMSKRDNGGAVNVQVILRCRC